MLFLDFCQLLNLNVLFLIDILIVQHLIILYWNVKEAL